MTINNMNSMERKAEPYQSHCVFETEDDRRKALELVAQYGDTGPLYYKTEHHEDHLNERGVSMDFRDSYENEEADLLAFFENHGLRHKVRAIHHVARDGSETIYSDHPEDFTEDKRAHILPMPQKPESYRKMAA